MFCIYMGRGRGGQCFAYREDAVGVDSVLHIDGTR